MARLSLHFVDTQSRTWAYIHWKEVNMRLYLADFVVLVSSPRTLRLNISPGIASKISLAMERYRVRRNGCRLYDRRYVDAIILRFQAEHHGLYSLGSQRKVIQEAVLRPLSVEIVRGLFPGTYSFVQHRFTSICLV